jgi:hypothetical protein
VALVALTRNGDRRVGYGLAAPGRASPGSWTADDTAAALSLVCDAYNDAENSRASTVSRYDHGLPSPETAAAASPTKGEGSKGT